MNRRLNILFIYHERLPEPDTNAGDLRLWEMVRILGEAGHSVTFLAGKCRLPKYRHDFEGIGVRCVIDETDQFGRYELLAPFLRAGRFDCAVCVRYMTFNLFDAPIHTALPRCAVVLDTLDLHYLRTRREAELSPSPGAMETAATVYREEWAAMTYADSVWVVTETEKNLLGGRVKLGSVVPTIHRALENPPDYSERKGIVFLGGYQHAPNIDAVHHFMRHIYPVLTTRLPNIPVTIAGSQPPETFAEYARGNPNVVITGFIPDHRQVLASHRIGVAPLRYGAGMKGKIGEYLCCGLPCVTTSIGAEGMGLTSGRDCMIVDDPVAFADAIASLYQDEALWRQMSLASCRFMERYSPDAVRPMVLSAVMQAVQARRRQQQWWRRLGRAALKMRRWVLVGR